MQQELDDMAKGLKKQLKTLETIGNGAFKEMDPEKYAKIQGKHIDLNATLRAARNGDTEKLNELAQKYANIN